MGGACRESYKIAFWRRWLFTRRAWRYHWRVILKDNLAWIVCAIRGHRPYNTACVNEPPEHACRFCGAWLRDLDPKEWYCAYHDHSYAVPGSCPACREAYKVPIPLLFGRRDE